MKHSQDFDFIASKFDEENITAPASLSETQIEKKINEGNGKMILFPKKQKRTVRNIGVIAACFVLVFVSVLSVNAYSHRAVKSIAVADGVVRFGSYSDLTRQIKKNREKDNRYRFSPSLPLVGFSKATSEADGDIKYESASTELLSDTVNSVGYTNVQVAGIDEGDIVKNDGKYLYLLDSNRLMIFAADGETVDLVYQSDRYAEGSCDEMFLSGDRLVLLGNDYETDSTTCVRLLDITDRSHPVLLDEYRQSGYYTTARMVENTVYIVSDYWYDARGYGNYIPECTVGDEMKPLPIENICAIENTDSTDYCIVGALDIKTDTFQSKTKAVIGAARNVYCNDEHLYVIGDIRDKSISDKFGFQYSNTEILKYSLNGTEVNLIAAAHVEGTTDDQFSVDEYEGNLRIATTTYQGTDSNHLFVLDENLNQIGKVTGFAKEESIKAVRFMEDIAYVITYEQTDPLFVLDLSDPQNPEITGEVKIDGFSNSLTPVDSTTLLGIGYGATDYGDFVAADGLKIVLFDVSDMKDPKVLDEKVYENASSEAQYNHKAILVNREKGYFAVPYYEQTYYAYDDVVVQDSEVQQDIAYPSFYSEGAVVIRTDGGKIRTEEYETEQEALRCTYIGDYLYVLHNDSVSAIDLGE